MADALGSGWLTQLIVAVILGGGSLFAALRWVARWAGKRWSRRPVEDKEALAAALEAKSDDLVAVTIEKAALEIRLDTCIGEIRYWRAGRVPPDDARVGP